MWDSVALSQDLQKKNLKGFGKLLCKGGFKYYIQDNVCTLGTKCTMIYIYYGMDY